jgi:hypothetical protein
MASEDELRPYVEWYVNALTSATQAIYDNKSPGDVIHEAVDGLTEEEARNVLQVMLCHQAQQVLTGADRRMMGADGREWKDAA